MPEPGGRLGSVRVRVTAVAALAVLIVLTVAGFLLVTRQRAALVDQLDRSLETDAERIAASIGTTGRPPAFGEDDDRIVLALDARGRTTAVSAEPDEALPPSEDFATSSEITIDGEQYRVAASDDDSVLDGTRVFVAASLEAVDENVDSLASNLLVAVPLTTAALGVVVWFVVGRTLRPVERIRSQVAAIGLTELDRRVPVPPGNDEIARLARTMNEMLARLERGASQQRRFVSDASHELRTPLARMRTELEVDEREGGTADSGRTRRSMLEEIDGLQTMIDDLLVLARSDAGLAPDRHELVDLDEVVLDEVRARRAERVPVDATRVSGAQVLGNAGELRRMVRNLLDNAARHATARIVVELAENGATAVLAVSDDGPGVPVEHRGELFERFTRLDESRTGTAGGSGLGLAIVHDIVTGNGGHVVVDDAPIGGARFTVTLPRPG